MYNSKGKTIAGLQNTITLTPIKVEVDLTANEIDTASGVFMPKEDRKAKAKKSQQQQRYTVHKVPPTIETFWPTILEDVKSIKQVDAKHQVLPLARIKKIMKLDENAKMIAAEAPLLFAKACEYFIQELTMRAWVYTDEGKRRTLQRSDIAQAISNCDQFDFLIDIVPRVEINVVDAGGSGSHDKESTTTKAKSSTAAVVAVTQSTQSTPRASMTIASLTPEQQQSLQQQHQHLQQLQILQQQPQQLQYFIQLPGQSGQQTQLHQIQQVQQLHPHHHQHHLQQAHIPTNGLTLGNQQLSGINIVTAAPQNIILAATPTGTGLSSAGTQQPHPAALVQGIHNHQQQQQIQIVQQIVTPNGEITNVPIALTSNQLNILRMQIQQQQQQQQHQQQQAQVLIPTHIQTQPQQTQIVHIGPSAGNMSTSGASVNSSASSENQNSENANNVTNIQGSSAGNIYLSAGPNGSSVISTDRNLGSTAYRTNC